MKKLWDFLKGAFKKNFIAGTLVLVPIFATVWVLKVIVVWADTFFISILPASFRPETFYGRKIPGMGILVTVVFVLFAGLITRLYLGRKLVRLGDKIISRIPIGRSIYMIIKDFLSSFLSQDKEKFKRVALIEWPCKGTYMMGFVTGRPLPSFKLGVEKEWVNLFIPTSPPPTTGFYVIFPKDEVKILEMGVDSAFKTIISSGLAGSDYGQSGN
jgi:uncharacterized membrane protein